MGCPGSKLPLDPKEQNEQKKCANFEERKSHEDGHDVERPASTEPINADQDGQRDDPNSQRERSAAAIYIANFIKNYDEMCDVVVSTSDSDVSSSDEEDLVPRQAYKEAHTDDTEMILKKARKKKKTTYRRVIRRPIIEDNLVIEDLEFPVVPPPPSNTKTSSAIKSENEPSTSDETINPREEDIPHSSGVNNSTGTEKTNDISLEEQKSNVEETTFMNENVKRGDIACVMCQQEQQQEQQGKSEEEQTKLQKVLSVELVTERDFNQRYRDGAESPVAVVGERRSSMTTRRLSVAQPLLAIPEQHDETSDASDCDFDVYF
ncbi:uncharacterized protein [Antedon mediterranea]|uniref:uncharacterized protein n=1 Tax=Antedon mediterranea TaxID=105859 RepID=UPI003AF6D8AD